MQRGLSKLESKVYELVETAPHSSASEVASALRRLGTKFNRNNLDRLLTRLSDAGILRAVESRKGRLFETRLDPHAHLRCLACESISNVPFEPVRHPFFYVPHADKERFIVQDLVFDVYGYCSDCASRLAPWPNVDARGRPIRPRSVEEIIARDGAQVPAVPIVIAYNRALRNDLDRLLSKYPNAMANFVAVFRASLPGVKTKRLNRPIKWSEHPDMSHRQASMYYRDMHHAIGTIDVSRAGSLSELVDMDHVSAKPVSRYEYRRCSTCKRKVRVIRLREGYEHEVLEAGHKSDCYSGGEQTLHMLGLGPEPRLAERLRVHSWDKPSSS